MENFNLENVENVTYDGKEVHEVKLDGTSIWKFTPKLVTGFHTQTRNVNYVSNSVKDETPSWIHPNKVFDTQGRIHTDFQISECLELSFKWDDMNLPAAPNQYSIEFSNNRDFKNTGSNNSVDHVSIIYSVPNSKLTFTIPKDSPVIAGGYKNSLQRDGYLQSHTNSYYYARIAINRNKDNVGAPVPPYDWSPAINLRTPHSANDLNLCARVKYNHPTGNAISVRWKIMNGQKVQNKFHLYRASGDSANTGSEEHSGSFKLEDWEELPFPDQSQGPRSNGEYIDTNVEEGKYYYYYIVDIQNKGKPNELRGDPSYVVRARCRSYGPMEMTFTNTNKVSLPINTTYDSGFLKIDWGDGTFKEFDLSKYQYGRIANNGFNWSNGRVELRKHEYDALSHTYSTTGNYTVKIYGELRETNFNYYHGDAQNARKANEESNTKLTGCALGDTAPQSIESLCEGSEVQGLSWGISSANPQLYLPESILSLKALFKNCQKVGKRSLPEYLINGQWNTSNVRNFSYMYSGTNIYEFGLNIYKASDLTGMFIHVDTDRQDTFTFHSRWPSVQFNSTGGYGDPFGKLVLSRMFSYLKGVKEIKFRDPIRSTRYGESGKPNSINVAWMFADCSELTNLGEYGCINCGIETWDVTHFDKNATYAMFGGTTTKLAFQGWQEELNLSNWCMPGAEQTAFGGFATGPWYDNVSNRPKWNCS